MRPQFFQRPLLNAGYIGAGNTERGSHFPLCQGNCAAQTVPQANDLPLPWGEDLPNQLPQAQGAVPVVDVLQHGVINAHHIHQL